MTALHNQTTMPERPLKQKKNLVDDSSNDEADEDPDYTSSSGSSSEEEDDEDEPLEDPPVSETRPTSTSLKTNNELRTRLAAFLPQIEQSNRELAHGDASDRRIDDVDEDQEHYIEMNLGLGVLSERRPDDSEIKTKDDTDDQEDDIEVQNSKSVQLEGHNAKPTSKPKNPIEEL